MIRGGIVILRIFAVRKVTSNILKPVYILRDFGKEKVVSLENMKYFENELIRFHEEIGSMRVMV